MSYQRIATEEAFAIPELFDCYRRLLADGSFDDPGFLRLWGFYLSDPGPRATGVRRRLVDLDDERLGDKDATGIARQVLSLTSPGVQVLDATTAVSIARLANDRLAEALGVPVCLHPNTPSKDMIGPMLDRGLDGAIFGFGVETALHLLRIIVSGVFDRFPKLKIVVGHLGEALPFWPYRLDFMHRAMVKASRYPGVGPLSKKISDYLRENVWITTSGMPWEPAILFVRSVIGADRVMYAMDCPYQYVPEEVAFTDALPLTEAELRAFCQGNAESVFGFSSAGPGGEIQP
ncbi:MAG: amidohydrolase family protein [Gammaproteobacteria bacterium]|nr:amidohydrolase family protein [Gammaproteobacteria bacterium]